MTLQEMREARAKLLNRRKELHDLATKEERDFTEAEQAEFDKCKVDAEALARKIEQAEDIEAEQAELNTSTGRKTAPPRPTPRIEGGHNNLADDPTGGYGNPECTDINDPHARRWFGRFALDVANATHAVSEKLRKWHSAYLAAGDGMTASIGSEGAYLIPAQFAGLVDRITLEAAVVRPRATRVPMTSPRISFPMVDDTSHSSTVFGGILAYFKSEESQLTSSKPAFTDSELTLHRLTALCYASNEMIDWSPLSLGTWLPMKMAQAVAWKEDQKFISGNGGAGEPTGLLNAMCIIEIDAEAGQAANTIIFENVVKMDARLFDQTGRASIIWIANRTCKTQLPRLVISDGASATPIFLPADGAAGRPLATLYGYPIVFTEHAQALGTAGDLMLCNLAEYYVGDATGKTRTARDMGLKFDYDQTAFRVVTYTGGLCPWRSAFTPENGDTLSPVVSVADR